MMIEGSIVTIGVLAWLFLRLAQEGELGRSSSSGASTRVGAARSSLGRAGEVGTRRLWLAPSAGGTALRIPAGWKSQIEIVTICRFPHAA